jgi:hypothetical protein
MNELGALFWLASIVAVFSLPFVFLAVLMCLVRRIRKRTLLAIIVADLALWGLAAQFWLNRI